MSPTNYSPRIANLDVEELINEGMASEDHLTIRLAEELDRVKYGLEETCE